MSEKNIKNDIEKEDIEGNNNEQNQEEEYEEENMNQPMEEEDGQEFAVAFDIQINDGSYILLIGKTEESKLILRLIDKEDENKPFYQNEFSLEELKEINNYFLNFTQENEAIDSIIKSLNENDKEIEILDENNIKLTVQINEEGIGTTNVDFILPKISYEIEGEEEPINKSKNIENGMINPNEEEEIEEVENDNNEKDNYVDNVEHEEANLEYSEDNNVEKNGEMPSSQVQQNIDNNQQNKFKPVIEAKNEINLNIQNKQNQIRQEPKEVKINLEEITKENNRKEREHKKSGDETKISRVIEELKNNLDSLGGAMNYIEQDEEEQEQNVNEEEINNKNDKKQNGDFNLFKNEVLKMINKISETFNNELQKQKEFLNAQQKNIKDENEKKMKDLLNKLNMKDNEINNIKNNFNKALNEKINNLKNETKKEINKLNDEIKNIKNMKNQENSSGKKYERAYNDSYKRGNNEIEKITNNMNSKIRDIEQKINNMKNDINKNNKAADNINIKSLVDKMNNFENRLKKNDETLSNNTKLINDKKNNTDNKIMSLETKINNLETSIKERRNLYDRISSLETKSKNLENKINNLENNKKILDDNEEIKEKINNLENIINELEADKNETELNLQKMIEELNNNDTINKINDLINLTDKQENDIKNLSESFNKLKMSIPKSIPKTQYIIKQPKDKGEFSQKISISSDENRKPSSSNNKRKYKSQTQMITDINQNNMSTKDYRIIRQRDSDSNQEKKKYVSQTFNRSNQLTSHSVNRLNIRPDNEIDNNFEFQINTRPRSRSKGHKKKKHQKQNYEYQPVQSKYKIQNYPYTNVEDNQYENENGLNYSNIINEENVAFIEDRLRELFPDYDLFFNLVYRASEHGDKASDFHERCDKIGPNITFVKTRNEYIFGGFTVKNWEHLKRDINVNKPNLGSASRDPKAFGFSVNYQKIYENERKNEFAIWCNRNYGPTFKNNFFQIFDNAFQKGGYCSSRHNSHFGGQKSDYEITGGEAKFKIYDIEVFEILFQ